MPFLKNSGRNKNGSLFFVYDISNDDPSDLAEQMSMRADRPIAYQGRALNGGQAPISAFEITDFIASGGKVACKCEINGVEAFVRFMRAGELTIVPSDSNQSTADYLVGAVQNDYQDDYGMYDDMSQDIPQQYDNQSYDEYNYQSNDYQYQQPIQDAMVQQQQGFTGGPMSNSYIPQDEYGNNDYAQQQNDSQNQQETKVGVGEWLLTLLLLAIPIVNLVFIIVTLVSKKTKKSKKTFIIAELIWLAISVLISAILVVTGISSALLGSTIQPRTSNTNAITQNETTNNENTQSSQSQSTPGTVSNTTNTGTMTNQQGNSSTVTFGNNASSARDSSNYAVTRDKVAIIDKANGGQVAIVTLSMTNNGTDRISPRDALDITGHQGNVTLNGFSDPQTGFDPNAIDTQVEPGTTWSFQVGYEMLDGNDQKFKIIVLDKQTRATLLEQEQN